MQCQIFGTAYFSLLYAYIQPIKNGEFLKLANGQVTAGNFLAEGLVIGEEALASLLTQPASTNHLAEQRVRAVFRVTSFAVQGFHD